MSDDVWSPGWRETQLDKLRFQPDEKQWDIIVIGGGITGAGILREATRKGLKALLVEQKDFSWGTSSRSSKMVHGGLRYLGSGQFGLTLDSVKERQRLLQEAPGLVDPLNFLMGHYKGGFPGPFIFNLLLTIYDWMAGKRNHRFIKIAIPDFAAPGISNKNLKGATQFADAVTDDSRLVLRVLHEAIEEGGVALNYVSAQDTIRENGKVTGVRLQDEVGGQAVDVQAKVIVNATGAWTDELRTKLGADSVIRPLRGSHLVLPSWRLPAAYSISFFHPTDKRPVFAFPWEGVTVIGTTDLDHQQDMKMDASITQEEVDYLLGAVNLQFPGAQITETDIISSYSGVRPVVGTGSLNPSSEKREHTIWDDQGLVSVAGGKLTTFRLIALDVLNAAADYLPKDHDDEAPDVDNSARETFFRDKPTASDPRIFSTISDQLLKQLEAASGLTSRQVGRLIGRYGQSAELIVDNYMQNNKETVANTETLYAEIEWILQHESVIHLEDLLLRRTRLGILLNSGGVVILERIGLLCQQILGWSDQRWEAERMAYLKTIDQHYGLPKRSPLLSSYSSSDETRQAGPL